MVILTKDIERRLKRLSLKTGDLFSSVENIEVLKKEVTLKHPENQKFDQENYDRMYSQIPDGVYNNITTLIETIQHIYEDNITKHISYSPLNKKQKVFDACKKISYSKGNVITGRDKEIDQILLTLSRRSKRGVILIGEPGTGKTAIVREINTRLINGNVPFPLKGAKIYNLDIPYLFTHYKDDPMGKIVDILETASEDPKHILFIDEVHQLLNERFNDILKPYLTEGIRFIGSTTIDEYHNIVTEDKAVERRFTIVNVKEPSVTQTTDMMVNTKKVFEGFHNCSITEDMCKYIAENGSRFLGHRKNPDKSFDILDKACSIMNVYDMHEVSDAVPVEDDKLLALQNDINEMAGTHLVSEDRILSKRHVDLAISDIAGIDYSYIKNSLNYNFIVESMLKDITGQDEAVKELANISNIMRHVNHVRTRPISVVLTVGERGVGKTKSVEMLAELLYGSKESVIEYDMAEFKSEFQLTELKGAPPGYVGYQKSGKLIKELRNNPQSVVHFKHINKCHESIAEYLLSSIKKGKMVDSAEREVSLNNTIIIFSVSLEDKDSKLLSKGGMGFDTSAKSNQDNLNKIVSKSITDAVDIVVKYNKLDENAMEFIFNSNIDSILDMYNNVSIDREQLKQRVFEKDCKNGHDVVNRLTSIIPKMIFAEVSQE